MVDFRKWLFALAVIGLLLGFGSSAAYAQGATQTITCNVTAGVNNIIRAEGLSELLGDVILNCSGGVTTPAGTIIPQENIQVSTNTNITSRLVNTSNVSEALLMIDEPFSGAAGHPAPPVGYAPGTGNAQTQLACLANNNTNCRITSKGVGIGLVGNYDGSAGHYNMFQGVQQGVNTIAWTGVPVDAPGTSGTRVIRITNLRGNAFQLGVSSTLVPTQILAIIAVNGSATLSITQPAGGTLVGTVVPGLLQPPGVAVGSFPGSAAYQQCNDVNTYLTSPTGVTTDGGISVSATEGFAYSFKPQNYGQIYNVATLAASSYLAPGTLYNQDIPGFTYSSESGFTPAATTSLVEPATGAVGFADHGTQLQFTVTGVPAGVSLYAPPYIYMTGNYGGATPVGVAVLVGQVVTTVPVGYAAPLAAGQSLGVTPPSVAVTVSGTSATLVYEVWYSDPSVQESVSVPISVSYVSNTGSNIPATTTTPATVGVEFSPQSTVGTASSGPIPRFGPSGSPVSLFSISPCSCNLLFPFVTNIAGFDTGVAIANTSLDPYGTSPQTGTVTLNYYGTTSGGGAAPAAQTTTSSVPGGSELIFTLSNGGNYGIAATPGFEGYLIAQANFQYCHGFAFVSDVGAQKLAEGYLAIDLDVPGLTRVGLLGNVGENKAH